MNVQPTYNHYILFPNQVQREIKDHFKTIPVDKIPDVKKIQPDVHQQQRTNDTLKIDTMA